MRKLILQSLIVLLYAYQVNAQSIDLKKINIEKSIDHFSEINLSELGTEIRYIPLNGRKEEFLLEKIVNIDFSQDRICVSDFQSCFLFTIDGVFLKKIGQQGRGPGEFRLIGDVKFSSNREFIYLSSCQFIYKYSLEGNFLKSIPLQNVKTDDGYSVSVTPWVAIANNLFLGNIPNFNGNQKNKLIVFDEDGKIIKEFKNYHFYDNDFNVANTWDVRISFYQFGDLYTFKKLKNDTLFRMTSDLTTYPSHYFYLGKYRPPFEKKYKSFTDFLNEIVNYISVNSVLETKDYFFLTCDFGKNTTGYKINKVLKDGRNYTYKNTLVKALYVKSNDRLTFLKHGLADGFINDIDGGINFFPQKIINDSIMVSWIDAYQLKAHVASNAFKTSNPKYPEKKNELEKLANSLNENDNPVLILLKLKEE